MQRDMIIKCRHICCSHLKRHRHLNYIFISSLKRHLHMNFIQVVFRNRFINASVWRWMGIIMIYMLNKTLSRKSCKMNRKLNFLTRLSDKLLNLKLSYGIVKAELKLNLNWTYEKLKLKLNWSWTEGKLCEISRWAVRKLELNWVEANAYLKLKLSGR